MRLFAPLLFLVGVFSLLLGIAHFFFPLLFDFEHAVPREGPPLKPFRLFFIKHATQRSDVLGIAWLMNHHTSFVLVSIGLLDLGWPLWLENSFALPLSLWIAVWWFLRAATQLYMGRRKGDFQILAAFALLGVVQALAVF